MVKPFIWWGGNAREVALHIATIIPALLKHRNIFQMSVENGKVYGQEKCDLKEDGSNLLREQQRYSSILIMHATVIPFYVVIIFMRSFPYKLLSFLGIPERVL